MDRDGTEKFELLEIVDAVPHFVYFGIVPHFSVSEEAKWFNHLSELNSINSEICPQFKYSYHTFKTPTVSKLESMGSVLCSFGIVEHHLSFRRS